jgi:hypothetical protein
VTTYRVGAGDFGDHVEGWVFDLPGCQTVGPDRDAALALLHVVIAEHLSWLDGHGEVTRDAFPFEVKVIEEVNVAELDVGGGEFCFADDLRPATPNDVERTIRRLGFARKDLIELVRPLPDTVLDWVPPPSALRIDDWAPEVRSIRAILQHVAGADGYYARNVGSTPWPELTDSDRTDLFSQRQRAITRLRALTEDDRSRLFKHRPGPEEHWTVRKALRRFIAHERFHTREIEQRLAWLLLGVPVFQEASIASSAPERTS